MLVNGTHDRSADDDGIKCVVSNVMGIRFNYTRVSRAACCIEDVPR